MVNKYKKLAIAVVVMLSLVRCKGDGTLLDLYPLRPIVNPETRALIAGNHIIHASLGARHQINGLTERGSFVTTNGFRSFDFNPYAWHGFQGIVRFRDDMIVNTVPDGAMFTLNYSIDYGESWRIFNETIVGGDLLSLGAFDVMDVFIKLDYSVLLAIQLRGISEKRFLLYHVDFEAKASELLFSLDNAIPLSMDFVDSNVGWLSFAGQYGNMGEVNILRTANGGRTWSEKVVLSAIDQPSIAAIGTEKLLVYNQVGDAFLSVDGGRSFADVSIDEDIVALQAVSAVTVYALLVDGIMKSVDGGETWSRLSAQVQGVGVSGKAMHFHDERNGIIYGADRIFITDDGGENWRILIYPYDYVVE